LASKREKEEIAWILRTDMPGAAGLYQPGTASKLEAKPAVLPAASDETKSEE